MQWVCPAGRAGLRGTWKRRIDSRSPSTPRLELYRGGAWEGLRKARAGRGRWGGKVGGMGPCWRVLGWAAKLVSKSGSLSP